MYVCVYIYIKGLEQVSVTLPPLLQITLQKKTKKMCDLFHTCLYFEEIFKAKLLKRQEIKNINY